MTAAIEELIAQRELVFYKIESAKQRACMTDLHALLKEQNIVTHKLMAAERKARNATPNQ